MDKDRKDIRRQTYNSDSELSDFELVQDDAEALMIPAIQPIVQYPNQIQVEERQEQDLLIEGQVPEDEVAGTGTEGSSEDEGGSTARRPIRKCKKPDWYGDWEYEREEESE